MKIYLHIGPDGASTDRMQRVLDQKRDLLLSKGVLHARTPGARNHTRLFMAVSAPDAVDALRFHRGYVTPEQQSALRDALTRELMQEVAQIRPEVLILSCHQLGACLSKPSEFRALRDSLAPLSEDIRIVAHLDDPARMLLRRYTAQLLDGRSRGLDLELGLTDADSWWDAALATRPDHAPQIGRFAEAQGAAFWLDYRRLQAEWEAVFGAGSVTFRSLDLPRLYSADATGELRESFGIDADIGRARPEPLPMPPSASWLARCRLMNDALLRLLAQRELTLPRPLWRKLLNDIRVPGEPIAPGSLSAISERFAGDLAALCAQHPGLDPARLAPDAPCAPWTEADPTRGFRATQYLTAFLPRIERATREAASPASNHLPEPVQRTLAKLTGSPFAPHNRLGSVDETSPGVAYTEAPRPALPEGSTGTVIVGCMKNEAPYILEWVAYHRAIGVDNFLIYTNGCEDGTREILDRLQALGHLEHRDNEGWQGKSPQQWALDQALSEPMIRNAEWIAHIDVDEFINVRCGNGTLADLLARVPDATNVAMTWRLFGHNGVTGLEDRVVIEQFDRCAPKYCPKPHTAWGFKTLFRNIGAYGKISCHRPNKLSQETEESVKWVNGSGADMTRDVLRNGWRNSRKTIGYDLVQLNHYALRSAESFLIKRQRGRALHVDRSIGLNYWIRMDWCDVQDVTIQRNLPRLRAEYDRLLADPELRRWHAHGLAWHRAKARELHATPEFEALYRQALDLKLTATERVAYALALDVES